MATIQAVKKAIEDHKSIEQATKELRELKAKDQAEQQINKEVAGFYKQEGIKLYPLSDSKIWSKKQ